MVKGYQDPLGSTWWAVQNSWAEKPTGPQFEYVCSTCRKTTWLETVSLPCYPYTRGRIRPGDKDWGPPPAVATTAYKPVCSHCGTPPYTPDLIKLLKAYPETHWLGPDLDERKRNPSRAIGNSARAGRPRKQKGTPRTPRVKRRTTGTIRTYRRRQRENQTARSAGRVFGPLRPVPLRSSETPGERGSSRPASVTSPNSCRGRMGELVSCKVERRHS